MYFNLYLHLLTSVDVDIFYVCFKLSSNNQFQNLQVIKFLSMFIEKCVANEHFIVS